MTVCLLTSLLWYHDMIDPLNDSDLTVARLMRENLEPLLLEYKVDLGIYGHHHSYQVSSWWW